MITTRVRLCWLLTATLVAMTISCDHDGVIGPVEPKEGEGQSPASVRLVPTKLTYIVGENVLATVFIENATNVGSVGFKLRYNQDVLQYLGAVPGDFMRSDGSHADFMVGPTAGEITIVWLRSNPDLGASGSGVLATFEFLAVGPGPAGFAFTGGNVRGPRLENRPASFSTISVQVVPAAEAGTEGEGHSGAGEEARGGGGEGGDATGEMKRATVLTRRRCR